MPKSHSVCSWGQVLDWHLSEVSVGHLVSRLPVVSGMWSVQPVESGEQFYCLVTWIACKIALRKLCLNVSISCSLRLSRKSEISVWSWQVWCTGMICKSTARSAVTGEGQAGYFWTLDACTWMGSIDILTPSIKYNGNSGAKFPHGDTWYCGLRLTPTSVCAQILVWLLGMMYILSLQPQSVFF